MLLLRTDKKEVCCFHIILTSFNEHVGGVASLVSSLLRFVLQPFLHPLAKVYFGSFPIILFVILFFISTCVPLGRLKHALIFVWRWPHGSLETILVGSL